MVRAVCFFGQRSEYSQRAKIRAPGAGWRPDFGPTQLGAELVCQYNDRASNLFLCVRARSDALLEHGVDVGIVREARPLSVSERGASVR
jgi:hypothetical protein